MKKVNAFLVILFAISLVWACSGKKETAEETTEPAAEVAVNPDEWPLMDEFHMIMAESFHPFKDSANIEPAKANAAEMAKVAEKWATSVLPEKVNTDETKANLEQLKTATAAFAVTVQSADATKIGEELTTLHDLFHKLQEAWYGKGEEHKH